MKLRIELIVEGPGRPPVGAPIRVQVRDTSLQDAPARVLAEHRVAVRKSGGQRIAQVTLNFGPEGRPTVWAHVDVDGDGRVSRGDYVSTRSYPASQTDETPLQVVLRAV
jgi:uncharacterized lipoprotein YbaY